MWVDSIEIEDGYLFDELGTIEAAWHMQVDKLGPFVVEIACQGNNLYDNLDGKIAENRKRAYQTLAIPEDFQYTKLY